MKDIAVLLSTYNGEDHIAAQLDSILQQSQEHIRFHLSIYVRDDGSSDKTLDIVEQYCKDYCQINLLESGPNLGYSASFLKLLKSARADYYFFSDQDDVWLPHKITDFLQRFESEKCKSTPIGVFSDGWVADQDARPTGTLILQNRKGRVNNGRLRVEQQIFEYFVQGASFAINHAAKICIQKYDISALSKEIPHDYLLGLIVSCNGLLLLLDKPEILYRQTGTNEVGSRNPKPSILDKLRKFPKRIRSVEQNVEVTGYILSKTNEYQLLQYSIRSFLSNTKNPIRRFSFFWRYRSDIAIKRQRLIAIVYSLII